MPAFTLKAIGRLGVLTTQVEVMAQGIGQPMPDGTMTVPTSAISLFTGIWDTGASGSCISQAVVDACGLQATGMIKVHGVNGVHDAETYLVHIGLPGGVLVNNVRVTKGILPGGVHGDLLIGMDIIGAGDFAVTNKDGHTWFSFRTPSRARFDFVAEEQTPPLPRVRPPKPKKVGKQHGKNKR